MNSKSVWTPGEIWNLEITASFPGFIFDFLFEILYEYANGFGGFLGLEFKSHWDPKGFDVTFASVELDLEIYGHWLRSSFHLGRGPDNYFLQALAWLSQPESGLKDDEFPCLFSCLSNIFRRGEAAQSSQFRLHCSSSRRFRCDWIHGRSSSPAFRHAPGIPEIPKTP